MVFLNHPPNITILHRPGQELQLKLIATVEWGTTKSPFVLAEGTRLNRTQRDKSKPYQISTWG